MGVVRRFNAIRAEVPANVKIVAVSKTKPVELIRELYVNTGHALFGENKAQELSTKQELLPLEIKWHFIGHLQSNKVKIIAPFVSMIQSVDSFKLLKEINKEAARNNVRIQCLLQFFIAREEAKFGFSMEEARHMLDELPSSGLDNIVLRGVMGMATFTDDFRIVRSEFRTLRSYFEQIKSGYFSGTNDFNEISMGMSDDYPIAIDEGSTMVRIGSGIFGER